MRHICGVNVPFQLLRAWKVAVLPAVFSLTLHAAPPITAPQEGLRENAPRVHALIGAKVVTEPGSMIDGATVIIRDGRIEAVGRDVSIPEDARKWPLQGRTIYAGFIDPYAVLGKEVSLPANTSQPASWNPKVHPERHVLEAVSLSDKTFEALRNQGFTTAQIVPASGIFRGKGVLMQLANPDHPDAVLKRRAGHHLAFELHSKEYPKSLMGCIALIRQTFYDAQWSFQTRNLSNQQPSLVSPPGDNASLIALYRLVGRGKEPAFFLLGDETDINRASAIAEEFKLRKVLVDSGYAYRQWRQLKRRGGDLILTVNYPNAPDVSHPDRLLDISLERLQHWELAPGNAGMLEKQGIRFALSTHHLSSKGKFWGNVRKAVQYGLSEEKALQALTTEPARMFGMGDRLGRVANGLMANLVVSDGNLFTDRRARIRQVWVGGELVVERNASESKAAGTWEAAWTGTDGPALFRLSGSDSALKFELDDEAADDAIEATISLSSGDQIAMKLPGDLFAVEGHVLLSGFVNEQTMVGRGLLPNGTDVSWSARRLRKLDKPRPDARPLDGVEVAYNQYPAGAFPGWRQGESQRPQRVFVEGATIWTCGPQGIIKKGNLVIEDGKIVSVGKDAQPNKKSLVISGEGKHVTPGLIDCHSHTAIRRGVNEGSHAVTCEVRIGDVVDPTDINLYRQLAGGLTTANLLHGSANPMGGQNQVIKLRWGKDAEQMKFASAKPGVKFALGENVKQSNWGDEFTTRYPQTRMGVEQIMRDTFLAAREYGERKRRHSEEKSPIPWRTNLRLEAVLEILNRQRLVHIHSYRQDEILMFAKLAKEFQFEVGTFQHVLEGYKVAEAIREIGAGASSFSDWWAYKFEVYDAIPHNGTMLHRQGVLTSFNSDDSELACRMNAEAAKAIKYGGLDPETALKFVTINPARQLRVDRSVGSLEIGKDADFAIWNGNPLSTLTRCEQTWIEGVNYFSDETDEKRRDWVEKERRRLIAKAIEAAPKKKPKSSSGNDEKHTVREAFDSFTPWGQYRAIDYQELYHDGQSLHVCTGCYCDFR